MRARQSIPGRTARAALAMATRTVAVPLPGSSAGAISLISPIRSASSGPGQSISASSPTWRRASSDAGTTQDRSRWAIGATVEEDGFGLNVLSRGYQPVEQSPLNRTPHDGPVLL